MAIATRDFQCLLYAVRDHVATITLNRPERRNALNPRAYAEVEAAFADAARDEEALSVPVTLNVMPQEMHIAIGTAPEKSHGARHNATIWLFHLRSTATVASSRFCGSRPRALNRSIWKIRRSFLVSTSST